MRRATPLSDPHFVDARKASERFNVPYEWLRDHRQRARHDIPFYRIGHLVRFRLTDLEQWRQSHAEQVKPGARH